MKKKSTSLVLILFSFVVVIYAPSCSSCDVENSKTANSFISPNEVRITKNSFKISYSTGGGITGLKRGYNLFSNGIVNHWKQLSFTKDTIDWSIDADSIRILQFKEKLENSGVLGKKYSDVGNFTTYLKYETKDTTYSWSWAGNGLEGNVPVELKEWYGSLSQYCLELNK